MKKFLLSSLMLMMFFLTSPVSAQSISIRLVDGEVRTLLSSLAKIGHMNILIDDSITGKITVSLENIEPIDAIRMVADMKNFTLEYKNSIWIVSTKQQEKLSTYVLPVKYGNPDDLKNAIMVAMKLRNDSEENATRIIVDQSTNSIIFHGTQTDFENAQRILNSIDVPAKQISIEARIISLNKDASKELGIEWQWSSIPQYPDVDLEWTSRRVAQENSNGNLTSTTIDVPYYDIERTLPENAHGILQFGRGPDGFPFEWYYGAKINALISQGKANILSRPNISTIQGREAVINIGGKVPVPTISTTNNTTTTSIEYRDAGIILKCIPRVNEDGSITSKIHVEISTPIYVESMKAYQFQNRSADTMLRVMDGGTIVIGGLMSEEESRAISKVPILGDIPILGELFKNRKKSKTEQELTIFLTAKVLD